MIKKIALLATKNEISPYELNKMRAILMANGITSKLFDESNDIDEFNPDCVITLTPQHPKLTRFPTYGLMNRPVNEYLELPRFLRNILTYDGYLTISPHIKQMLEDLTFGARKLDSSIAHFDFTPYFDKSTNAVFENTKLTYFEPEINKTKYKNVLTTLQTSLADFQIFSNKWGLTSTIQLLKNVDELLVHLNNNKIGLCLDPCHDESKIIPQRLLEILASNSLAIAPYSKHLHSLFGDNILFFSPSLTQKQLCSAIRKYVTWANNNPKEAILKTNQAHEIFIRHFSSNLLINNLQELHANTLVKKGYLPNKDEKKQNLPSVSYIIRTGGDNRQYLERALTGLVNQNYPKLNVIFVIHKPISYINEIISSYPSLHIQVIQSYKSSRSKAICDGMAAVKTDLFGLHDDDDELHPNHVRTLVKSLKYHKNRDWRGTIGLVYSGSIKVDNRNLFEEEPEFIDTKLLYQGRKRAIEHFRFYQSIRMANHAWYMMSNSWLAERELIDDELLTNPDIDTCEDLYFELQLAQKTHFAFSAEVTLFHHFHTTNSTIIDKFKHIPDTQRIALRNFSRSFPGEFQYDNVHTPIGKQATASMNVEYSDHSTEDTLKPLHNIASTYYPLLAPQFYSSYANQMDFRSPNCPYHTSNSNSITKAANAKKGNYISNLFLNIRSLLKDQHIRKILFYKTVASFKKDGILTTLNKVISYKYNKRLYTNFNSINSKSITIKILRNILSSLLRVKSIGWKKHNKDIYPINKE
jgi:hypothetical protein